MRRPRPPRSQRPCSRAATLAAALVVVVAAAGRVLGQESAPRPESPPAPPPLTAPIPALEGPALGSRFTLPNGIIVLVAERPVLPIVNVRVALGAGAVLDPPDRLGLANLTALLLTRGTRGRTALEIDRAIEFVGGSLETEGGRDFGHVVLSVLRRDLALGLNLLADVLLRPTFPADEFERMRERVRASVRQSEEDPESVAARLFRRLAFPGHPYGAPVDGTEESLGAITRADVAAFYTAHYRPDSTIVAIVGAVTAGEVESALIARFGGWAVKASAAPGPPAVTLGARGQTGTIQREITQASVFLGQPTVRRTHPDYYPLVVASYVLGGGSSSRLYVRIREDRGLAYSVFAQFSPGRLGGMFLAGFQSENTRVREALTLVREELVRLRRDRVGIEELARAKAYLVGSFPLRMDTNAGVAALLLAIEQFDLGLDYPTRYRRGIEAVTAEDVLRAVRGQWDPDVMSLAIVANLRQAGLVAP